MGSHDEPNADAPSDSGDSWASLKQSPWGVRALVIFVVTLVIVVVSVFVITQESFHGADGGADEIAAIGDVLVGGTFLLAFFAGVIAVLTYADATRRPELVTTWSQDGENFGEDPLRFVQKSETGESSERIPLETAKLYLRIENKGLSAARHVLVAVFMKGIFFDRNYVRGEWQFLRLSAEGSQIEWRPNWHGYVSKTGYWDGVRLPEMWAKRGSPASCRVETFADDFKGPPVSPGCEISLAQPTGGETSQQ